MAMAAATALFSLSCAAALMQPPAQTPIHRTAATHAASSKQPSLGAPLPARRQLLLTLGTAAVAACVAPGPSHAAFTPELRDAEAMFANAKEPEEVSAALGRLVDLAQVQ
eukprot:4113369-Pleurochrysis_carterae.AAC.1